MDTVVKMFVSGVWVFLFFLIAGLMGLKIRKGKRMGINLSSGNVCSKCGASLPIFRRPRNLRQLLWGGWTCEKCGAELDKWG